MQEITFSPQLLDGRDEGSVSGFTPAQEVMGKLRQMSCFIGNGMAREWKQVAGVSG